MCSLCSSEAFPVPPRNQERGKWGAGADLCASIPLHLSPMPGSHLPVNAGNKLKDKIWQSGYAGTSKLGQHKGMNSPCGEDVVNCPWQQVSLMYLSFLTFCWSLIESVCKSFTIFSIQWIWLHKWSIDIQIWPSNEKRKEQKVPHYPCGFNFVCRSLKMYFQKENKSLALQKGVGSGHRNPKRPNVVRLSYYYLLLCLTLMLLQYFHYSFPPWVIH